jgi:glycosyltransferase involved in cell wall biosynthesis
MLRILHINDARTWRGGEQQTLYLLEGLRRRGHEVALVAQPGAPLAERARAAALPVMGIRMWGEFDLRAAWELKRLVRRLEPQVLHYHTSHAHAIGAVAAALLGRRRPKTLLSRRVDFSIYRHSFFGLNGLKYRAVDRIVAISAAIRDALARDGIDPGRIDVVLSGVDPARFRAVAPHDLRAELGLDSRTKIVLNVAALAWHKGQATLVEAARAVLAAHPETFFAIAGEGEERGRLEARIRDLGLSERVRLLGFRADVPALLRGADLYVMPSWTEGLGTAVLDALSCGLPVVAARTGGIPEMIEDGETGLLVPPRDATALARAIGRLLDEPALAARLSAAGPKTVEERFSVDRMVEGNIAVYERLLG